MPYKSESQRKYMHLNLPDIARKWDSENGHDNQDNKKKKDIKRKALMIISIGKFTPKKHEKI